MKPVDPRPETNVDYGFHYATSRLGFRLCSVDTVCHKSMYNIRNNYKFIIRRAMGRILDGLISSNQYNIQYTYELGGETGGEAKMH